MTTLPLRIAAAALRRPDARLRYGPHPRQRCDLHLPAGRGPHPVAVVLHGGNWQGPYTRLITGPLCRDLAGRGIAALNVDYRRLGGDGGGWPQTFADVAAAIDLLAGPALDGAALDLDRVVLVGHSAGGQLALWAADRGRLPAGAPGARPRVRAARALGLAPVTHLERAQVGERLLGAAPHAAPERWEQADPIRRVPLPVPVAIVHGSEDETVDPRCSRDYVEAARAAGADAVLLEPRGRHVDPIDPSSAAWAAAARWLSAGQPGP